MSDATIGRDIAASPQLAKTRPALSRRALATVGAILAVAGGAWYGTDWWGRGRFIETTDDAYVGGNVTAISPHVAGFVSEIAVQDNQHVQAGQVLIRLDSRDFQAALDHAQAALEARSAALANLQALRTLQASTIQQATADLAARTARAAFTNIDSRRYAALVQTSAGSRQDAEKSFDVDQEAQAAMASARAGLDAARQKRPPPPSRRRRPTCKPRGSTSNIQKSARRSTAMSATARPSSAPTSPPATTW